MPTASRRPTTRCTPWACAPSSISSGPRRLRSSPQPARHTGSAPSALSESYLLLERELRDEELRLALLRPDAGLRALRDPDFAALLFDPVLRDDVLLEAELFDAELRLAPLFAAVRRPALRPLRVALAPVLLAAFVTEEAAFSRFL